MTEHKHLKRLARVRVKEPIFFITTGTHQRQPILAKAKIVSILVEEWTQALQLHGWAVGRYVVMPNHVHFFCAPVTGIDALVAEIGDPGYKDLSGFMQQWKQWTSKRIIRECSPDGPSGLQRFASPISQAEFFDHLIRSQDSYGQKWDYVRQNPVRAGLVKNPEDWLWQGQIHDLT